jgi:hypothetical protein
VAKRGSRPRQPVVAASRPGERAQTGAATVRGLVPTGAARLLADGRPKKPEPSPAPPASTGARPGQDAAAFGPGGHATAGTPHGADRNPSHARASSAQLCV